jgi:hypothetical protein
VIIVKINAPEMTCPVTMIYTTFLSSGSGRAESANSPYGFKGTRSAPRAWRRMTAHAVSRESWRRQPEAGATLPRGPAASRSGRSPQRDSARRRPPKYGPGQLPAPAERRTSPRVRERGHPRGAAIVEAEQDRRQGRLCAQANQ